MYVCVSRIVLFGACVPELLLIFNLCAFNWNSAGAFAPTVSLPLDLALTLTLALALTLTVTVTHLPEEHALAKSIASNRANKLQTSRRQNRKQHKFSHIFDCVRQAHATRNQRTTDGHQKGAQKSRMLWQELCGRQFLLPSGHKFITLIKIIPN